MNCHKCKWVRYDVHWDDREAHCSHPSVRKTSVGHITGEVYHENVLCRIAKSTTCPNGLWWAQQDTKRRVKNFLINCGGFEFLVIFVPFAAIMAFIWLAATIGALL